jgi:Thermolysin metallopeptidase, alpha-helical domain/Thermolysin metallopeptidase, catalytic domain
MTLGSSNPRTTHPHAAYLDSAHSHAAGMRCQFIPPYLIEALARAWPDEAEQCRTHLAQDEAFRAARAAARPPQSPPAATDEPAWSVHTANQGTQLPGDVVRRAGQPEAGDPAVDEAAVGGQAALDLFAEVYGRNSYDGAGAPVVMTVHYERDYNNAFWNGTQLVFGDGDGRVFERFTKPVDVLAHELTHAVTEFTAELVYRDQAGALNESVSDVFAACTKQRLLGQSAAEADWLIGAGIFKPSVQGRALRDMAAPGTAYDDPDLGRDPQVGHMDDFVVTEEDNGGVHLNSGIPNRAFQLAAAAIGGNSWDGAGAIWYAALTSGRVPASASFADFAEVTVALAGGRADQVAEAWQSVGVMVAGSTTGGVQPAEARANNPTAVDVVKSGGFMGRTVSGSVDLHTDDPRVTEVRDLVERIDLRGLTIDAARPDMYVYTFAILDLEPVDLPEHQLTDDLRRLAQVVLWTED